MTNPSDSPAVSPGEADPVVSGEAAALARADRALLQAAAQARRQAYAPYTRFCVGAAVRTRSGRIHTGANMENASSGISACAELGALQASVTAGDFQVIEIAVVGGPEEGAEGAPEAGLAAGAPTTPCGRCRQMILEAGQAAGARVRVLCANADLSQVLVSDIATLLPYAFQLGRPRAPS